MQVHASPVRGGACSPLVLALEDDMQNRRRTPSEITPEWEDMGLFKKGTGEFAVELVPDVTRNNRQDVVVRAFFNDGVEVTVVFPGRRAREAVAVERRLRALLIRANRRAASAKQPEPSISSIRLPVRIEGSWRPRFQRDNSGWDKKSFQLLAARWAFVDDDGMTNLGGKPPVA